MKNYLKFENVSTILNSLFLTLFGLILGYLTSMGLNLPVTAECLTSVAVGIVLFVFSYYNAKHQNTLFDNDTIYIPVDRLDKNQIDAINNYIEKAIEKNIKE